MNDGDIAVLASRLAPLLAPLVAQQLMASVAVGQVPALPARFSVEEFAWVIESHPETVRRYIRENHHGLRTKGLVSRDTPYKLQPGALGLFGVTAEIAAQRLASRPRAELPASGSTL